MKLVGIKEFYNITREKIISALNAAVIVTVCAAATFIVDASLDSTAVLAKPIETFPESSETEPVVVTEETSETTDTSESTDETNATTITVTVTVVSTPAPSESSSETSQPSETTAATTETTAATTASTTAETKEKVTEKELYLAVYATTTINVRSGPGTDYDVVKSLHAGDKIDVIAVTSNGWYKTCRSQTYHRLRGICGSRF